jgi:putative Mn2+ efflux pump MntP
MNFPALLLLALAMSTDAFAAAIGKGAAMQKPRFCKLCASVCCLA